MSEERERGGVVSEGRGSERGEGEVSEGREG